MGASESNKESKINKKIIQAVMVCRISAANYTKNNYLNPLLEALLLA
jgi:hypothetical protein